jgi:hypothetical protein
MVLHKKQTYAALDVLPLIVKFVPHKFARARVLSPLSLSFTQSHTLGNFITVNGREPFMKAGGADEEELWSEVDNNERSIDLSSWLSAISEFGRASETSNSSPVESNTNHTVPYPAVEETEVLGGAARSLLTRTRCSW